MRVDEFDFELPEELIALRPAPRRDASRLLVVRNDGLEDRQIIELPRLLRAGDTLVVNDARVLPVAVDAIRPNRVAREAPVTVELTLIERSAPNRWRAFARPAKRLREGDSLSIENVLHARVTAKAEDGSVELDFDSTGDGLDAALARVGRMPLPPYIARRRRADERDFEDYQTVFAREPGAVAAPTAGLHFSPALFEALKARGVTRVDVTLHVGPGTFLPVKVEDTDAHVMHAEWGRVSPAAATQLNAARAAGGRIVAVGTTSLRLLESAAEKKGHMAPFDGTTDLFITPGYRFRTADILLTNFHLPRSTLFMLACAFAGTEIMRRAYAHAIAARYRFYSYGDAMLLGRHDFCVAGS